MRKKSDLTVIRSLDSRTAIVLYSETLSDQSVIWSVDIDHKTWFRSADKAKVFEVYTDAISFFTKIGSQK